MDGLRIEDARGPANTVSAKPQAANAPSLYNAGGSCCRNKRRSRPADAPAALAVIRILGKVCHVCVEYDRPLRLPGGWAATAGWRCGCRWGAIGGRRAARDAN